MTILLRITPPITRVRFARRVHELVRSHFSNPLAFHLKLATNVARMRRKSSRANTTYV